MKQTSPCPNTLVKNPLGWVVAPRTLRAQDVRVRFKSSNTCFGPCVWPHLAITPSPAFEDAMFPARSHADREAADELVDAVMSDAAAGFEAIGLLTHEQAEHKGNAKHGRSRVLDVAQPRVCRGGKGMELRFSLASASFLDSAGTKSSVFRCSRFEVVRATLWGRDLRVTQSQERDSFVASPNAFETVQHIASVSAAPFRTIWNALDEKHDDVASATLALIQLRLRV